jgi:hypothetical protein
MEMVDIDAGTGELNAFPVPVIPLAAVHCIHSEPVFRSGLHIIGKIR